MGLCPLRGGSYNTFFKSDRPLEAITSLISLLQTRCLIGAMLLLSTLQSLFSIKQEFMVWRETTSIKHVSPHTGFMLSHLIFARTLQCSITYWET